MEPYNGNFKGKLIAFEGISGCGKGTQIELLKRKLEKKGEEVFVTNWNSDVYISKLIGDIKKNKGFTKITWSILHATDFVRRYNEVIIPELRKGKIVLVDRYYYTALTRDKVRGVEEKFIEKMYSFAIKPDMYIYLDIDVNLALKRRLERYPRLGYYSSGCDIYENKTIETNWIEYNLAIKKEYEKITKWNCNKFDGNEEKEIIAEKIFGQVQLKWLENK